MLEKKGAGLWAGGSLYGEGSTAQAYMALGGAVIGGGIGARGAQAFNSRYAISTQGLGSNLGNIRINRRTNEFTGILRNKPVKLENVNVRPLEFVKRPRQETTQLRRQFNKVRQDFLKDLAASDYHRAALKSRGLTDSELKLMENGYLPNNKWQVHHNKPLDDSGQNDIANLTLIKNDPYYMTISNYHQFVAKDMALGNVKTIDWPFIDTKYYP